MWDSLGSTSSCFEPGRNHTKGATFFPVNFAQPESALSICQMPGSSLKSDRSLLCASALDVKEDEPMHRICSRLATVVFFSTLLFLPDEGYCGEAEPLWSVFAYGGQWTDTRFVHIVFRGRTDFQSSYVWAAGVSRNLFDISRHLGTEAEFNLARNSGLQTHGEMNTAFSLRWKTFPWDRYVKTSLAYGLGISYAFERPPIEEEPERRASRTLIFMPAELTFAPPKEKKSPWEVMVRIHHRSGAFGFFKDAGGSNFVTAGLRYRF
jgi:hypothetical protein